MGRGLLSLIIYFSFSAVIHAQEPTFFRHDIGDANTGLPINCMYQDHQCMIWFGTAKGLARYDGLQWHDIPLGQKDAAVEVRSLFEDKQHRLWVGTASGQIFYLDLSRQSFELTLDEGHPTKPITSITQDHQGYIWFATYGEGAYVYTGTRMFNLDMDDGMSGQDLYCMTLTPSGDVWVGTDDGISICRFDGERKDIRKMGLEQGLPDQIITALFAEPSGKVWIGTFEYGVVYYDQASSSIQPLSSSGVMDEVTSFTLFDDNEIWISTRSSGVWRRGLQDQSATRLTGLDRLAQDKISTVFCDVEGNIWITTGDGILISGFRPFETLSADLPEIQSLFSDASGYIWIGTQKGLFRTIIGPKAHSEVIRVLPQLDLNVTQILQDKWGHLWIGTIDKGLYVYDPLVNKIRHHGSVIEQGGATIMSMAMTDKFIYVATLEGVVTYPTGKNILEASNPEFSLLHDPWPSNLHFVFQVFPDSKGRIWFATDGNGVFYIEGPTVKQLKGNDSLELKTVYSICEDTRGHLWFNTPAQGLVEYDGNRYSLLGLKEGLSSLNIASMYIAGSGDMVITHDKGIDLLEPDRRHFMYYNEEIGISNLLPGLNAGTAERSGHILSSGRNTLIKYHTPKRKLSIHPKTLLTAVKVFDRDVDMAREKHFSHGQNYFTFHYTGLWYTSPSAVKYLYKLEGYDLQWKESKDNTASYSNLPPGSYTFFVKASENKSFLDEPITAYTFVIAKPFWRTYWFIALSSLTLLGLMVWLIKARDARSERQALHKKDIIESQLAALKAQINPHFLFNSFNTLITLIDENPAQPGIAIEYVEKLSDFFRNILQYREQESIPLEEEWELVQNYVYLLQKRYGQNLRMHMDQPSGEAYIMPLTLQMLVENAVKHNVISEKYPLDIFISVDPDGYVSIRNNLQVKTKPEASTQFGLESIIRRYQLLSDKKVIVEKTDTSFTVRVPLIKK